MWILNCGGTFPAGVFDSKENAEKVIKKHGLSGTLTKYPINHTVYDWCTENEFFKPKSEFHQTPEFIGSFSSAYQEHYHYEEGECETGSTQ